MVCDVSLSPIPMSGSPTTLNQSSIHLLVFLSHPHSLVRPPVTVAPRGAASQRSDLPPLLLCFFPTFRPTYPLGQKGADWHLSSWVRSPPSDWEIAFCLLRVCACACACAYVCACVCVNEDAAALWHWILFFLHFFISFTNVEVWVQQWAVMSTILASKMLQRK